VIVYVAHGLTLALAWFLAVNVATSGIAMLLARRARGSASVLLGFRLLPGALSAAFVAGVFVPSYWLFEPRDVAEDFDLTLTMLAVGALVLIIAALIRGAAAWWRAAQRARVWTLTAQPMATLAAGIPAFRIDAPEPVMALVGILRPRLIVARGLIDALTAEELAASIEHEIGHHRSRDNLKRLIIRAVPDVLRWTPAAGLLERKWAAAAEHTADAGTSIGGGRRGRLALASALVKVARLMPAPASVSEPISTLVGGGEIAARVRRLIDVEDVPESGGDRVRHRAALLATIGGVTLGFAGYAPLVENVHRITEFLVRSLP
jgi:Zn-dependent protease with chaperone function